MTTDQRNGAQFLFNDMDHLHTDNPIDYVIDYDSAELYREADGQLDVSSKPLITSGDLIILGGLAQAAIQASGGFELEFYLFGVFYEYVFLRNDDYRKTLSVPLHKIIHGDGGRRKLKINYAVFDNAVEAHVKVKLTEVDSAFDFNGTVHAMTSAIEDPEYASILYFRDYDHRVRLEPEEEMILLLSRHIVVVPLGSQLILHFCLHVDDKEELITVTFVAKEGLTSDIQEIVYSKGVIQVEVNWRSERQPQRMNNGYGSYG